MFHIFVSQKITFLFALWSRIIFFFIDELGAQYFTMFFSTLFGFFTKHKDLYLFFFVLFFFFYILKAMRVFKEKSITSKKKVSYQSVKKLLGTKKRIIYQISFIFLPLHNVHASFILWLSLFMYIYVYVRIFFVDHNLIFEQIDFFFVIRSYHLSIQS